MSANCIQAAGQNVFKNRCPGRTCCPVHEKAVCVKYIQPPRPDSYKPERKYQPPENPLEGNTVYLLSYKGVNPQEAKDCRPEAVVNPSNIGPPCGPLESETVHHLSYRWSFQPPPGPVKPQPNIGPPCGPMQNVTTQRHDFPAKPSNRPDPIVPSGNIGPVCGKMDGRTVMMESYLPVQPEPLINYKPTREYKGPDSPLENQTVMQLSYMAPEIGPREIPPWSIKAPYKAPTSSFEGNTIYNGSFLAPGTFEPCDAPSNPCQVDICCCKYPTATEDLD